MRCCHSIPTNFQVNIATLPESTRISNDKQAATMPKVSPLTILSDTETTRRIVEAFFSHLSSRKISELPALFASEANYWVAGNPSHVPWAGDMDAHVRIPQLNAMFDSFKVFNLTLRNVVVEGRNAIAEFGVFGRLESGLEYKNEVVMAFVLNEFRQILSLREYLDNMQSLAHLKARNAAA
jgi:ketosteroid isomerase-like protein